MARDERSNGASPPVLAIPLLKSEIFIKNLFQKNVYLEINGPASDSQSDIFFSASGSSRAAGQFATYNSNGKNIPLHLTYILIFIWF